MRRLDPVFGGVGFLGGEGRVAPPVAAADGGGGRAEQDASAAATARRQPGGRAHQRHGTTVTPPFRSIWLLRAKNLQFHLFVYDELFETTLFWLHLSSYGGMKLQLQRNLARSQFNSSHLSQSRLKTSNLNR